MSEGEPAPTMVIGVGKAGLEVIGKLDQEDGLGWGAKYDHYFNYIAIDSSFNDITSVPDKATKVHLRAPTQYTESSKKQYPYLTKDLDIDGKGAQRQRPVGRFKLDNLDQPTWDAHFTKISDAISSHIRYCDNNPDINTKQLNVIHVHSLGGGTGSGSFPLLGQMLNRIVDDLSQNENIDIYTAGIGVVPEITHDIELTNPPGDPRYYANTYAALNDLQKLFESDSEEPLPVHLYSKHINQNPNLERFVFDKLPEPQSEISHSPYNHYFMLGVDEDQINGDNKRGGPETYQAMVDKTIVAAIYGLAMYGSELENWMPEADVSRKGFDKFGSFAQTQLSIPIDDVRAYCDLQERIAELREQVDPKDPDKEGTLIRDRNKKIEKRDELQAIIDDPSQILTHRDNSDDIEKNVEEMVKETIYRGDDGIDTTSDELDELADDLREVFDEEIIAYAMEVAADRIEDIGEDIRGEWREVVTEMYKDLEVASEPGFGINNETTVDKARDLNRFLNDKIEDLQKTIEELEEEQEDDDGGFFSDIFGGDDELEQSKEWVEYYRNKKEAFKNVEQKKEDVDALKRAVRERRDEVLERTVKPRKHTLEEEIESLKRDIEKKQDTLKKRIEDRDDKADELTDGNYGDRIGILALDEQKVRNELDRETLEEKLTSLAAFDEEDYLARDINDRIEARIDKGFAWESSLMTWQEGVSLPFGGGDDSVREVWMLHSEENQSLSQFEMLGAGEHNFIQLGDDGDDKFPTYEDPYTLQFLSYTLDAPITNLKMYAELEQAAEDGTLDSIIDAWSDYRLAFGYPEWYDREIQKVFEIEVSETLPRLPELDEKKLDVDMEGGELKNWLSSHGLASYLWHAGEWDDYDGFVTVEGLDEEKVGWKHTLGDDLTWQDMRKFVPSGHIAKKWAADIVEWDDLLDEVLENLSREEGIAVKLVPEE